ncbi:MAG TPA: hypothetical protein VF363_11390, partial [Candidatus Eisenbacteria bacterium]
MNRESAPRAEVAILAALAVLVGATATTRARTRDELNTLHTIPGVAEQIRLPGERPEPQDLDPRHQAVISVPSEFSQPLERVGEVAAPNTVEIAQYGEYEADLAYRDGGFLAVRFDPPFVPPYRITAIRFPSITTDGASAVFPSVRLCTAGGPFDGPQVTNPLVQVAPYVG